MASEDLALMAHLMRRAGFGATRGELERFCARGYESVVDELLEPSDPQMMSDDLIRRYHPDQSAAMALWDAGAYWLYRMISTDSPLLEKISLFWHGIFPTAYNKIQHGKPTVDQIRMFRRHGLGSFKNLLLELSRDPAMIFYLDNNENHRGAINENYGRELLELFSMGVGNYTEQDIKECARAFTGWTIGNAEYMASRAKKDSIWPYGRISWHFEYCPDDHDDGAKEFLGKRGRFNGEDVIEIICQQPATARFISRHLYNFFVADESPVPQWPHTSPRDPDAIEMLSQTYFDSDYNIRSMLRVLFNSDFFRSDAVRFQKVKSPAELIAGVLRLTGDYRRPRRAIIDQSFQMVFMGQTLIDPPSVEGWHTGTEWIDTGTLVERINFASSQFGDPDKPGISAMIDEVLAQSPDDVSPDQLTACCLEHLGMVSVLDNTRASLLEFDSENGDQNHGAGDVGADKRRRVAEMLQMIVTAPEFQRA